MTQEPHNPRILLRGLSAGGITKADIERRARELALIRDGSENYTEEDLTLARRELFGADAPESTTDDARSTIAHSRDPSEPVSQPGRQAHEEEPPDENTMAERLALEGVDEAQHEQMLEARRKRNQDSSSEET